MTVPWWKTGVLYQIYPRSYADSNGDGIGDLPGIIGKLDHLKDLGVDGIWLSPITPSPNFDFGYDVADYCSVDPSYGTLDDVDTLIREADRRGIRILMDLVPNHTSIDHPWFAEHPNYYVWADGKPDGSPPNNWISNFGGPAWTQDPGGKRYYLHNFCPEQPDLNWWNDDVRRTFDDIQRFWYDRGIAGFRIDVVHMIVKDEHLRDNPPIKDTDAAFHRRIGQVPVYNANRPELHDILRRWRKTADQYDPPRLLLGESVVYDLGHLTSFYGSDDELHLPMNMLFMRARFEAASLRAVVEEMEEIVPPASWPVWVGSNHDVSRMATRWAGNDPAKARLAMLMLLTLRGTPLLYQGDEIAMPDTELTREQIHDIVGKRFWPTHKGRDPERTPMHWTREPGAGFSTPSATPWLPYGDYEGVNVADQRDDPCSMLSLTRDLIALRRATPDLTTGDYASIESPENVWAWHRGEGTVVALNFGDQDASLRDVEGEIVGGTHRKSGKVSGVLDLGVDEGVVVRGSTGKGS